ncbi:MAG: serine/threonine-protein kinase [Byssovorax sp.]
MIGKQIDGRYTLTRLLGRGGMGAVYEAEPRDGGPRVAIKLIDSQFLSDDPSRLARFQREARAASAIESEHIARVLDSGADAATATPFIIMERLEGEDLGQLLKRCHVLAPDVALRITAQACLGLQAAHSAGVIHRDIKPANLFLARGPEGSVVVKILDFGIAKILAREGEDETTALTTSGMMGSPQYRAPEQARAARDVDTRADLWSLGVVLYRALAGRTPHQKPESMIDLIMAICTEPPPLIQSLAPWVPGEVAAVVHAALRIRPSERVPSAEAMLAAIEPLLAHGTTLRLDLLVPLDSAARQTIAPRLESPTVDERSPAALESLVDERGPAMLESLVDEDAMGTARTTANQAARAHEAPIALSPAPSRPWRRAAALGLGALAVTAVTLAVSSKPPSRVTATAPAVATSAVVQAESPAPEPVVPAVVAAPEPLRRVKLVISPKDAAVELDGTKVAVDDGVLEIAGALGSTHRVRLSRGKSARTGEVIVTEAGAIPPRMDLSPPRQSAPAGKAEVKARPKENPLVADKFQ